MGGRRIFTAAFSVLVLLGLARIYPLLDEGVRLWGFNHLDFLPVVCRYVYIILFAAMIILPFTRLTKSIGDLITDKIPGMFFESNRKWLYRLIFILIAFCLFIIFRSPTHFLGDGYSSIGNLASDTGTFYKWSEMGVTHMVTFIQSFIGPKNGNTARLAFQILSFISGAVTIWFFFLISQIISNRNIVRLLTFTVICVSPILLLFFGYVEYYPPLWVIFSAFIYFSLYYLVHKKRLLFPLLLLIAGMFIHMQMGIFIGAYVFLLFSGERGGDIYRQFKKSIWIAIGIVILILAILFVRKYTSNLYFEHIFLPIFQGKPIDPYYRIFSSNHLLDIVNELLLLSPTLPILIVFSLRNLKFTLLNKTAVFIGLVSLTSFLFLLTIDPKLGMIRDWDLFSLSSFGLSLFFIIMIATDETKGVCRLYPSMLILLLCSTTAYLMVNLNRDRSIDYFNYSIDLDVNRSFSSLVILHDYYKNLGDGENRVAVNNRIKNEFPEKPMTHAALDLLEQHKIHEAEQIIRMITPDRYSPQYHNLMSMYYMALGNYPQALEESDKVMQLSLYNYVYHRNRAWIYTVMNRDDLALESLREAYKLNNSNPRTIEGLAANFLKSNQFDSARFYCEALITRDSTNIGGYFILARMSVQLNQPVSARNYLKLYLRYGSSDTLNVMRANELMKIIDIIEEGNK
nr:hypothetical protein [candidate division Zixibacteria bacterium]